TKGGRSESAACCPLRSLASARLATLLTRSITAVLQWEKTLPAVRYRLLNYLRLLLAKTRELLLRRRPRHRLQRLPYRLPVLKPPLPRGNVETNHVNLCHALYPMRFPFAHSKSKRPMRCPLPSCLPPSGTPVREPPWGRLQSARGPERMSLHPLGLSQGAFSRLKAARTEYNAFPPARTLHRDCTQW